MKYFIFGLLSLLISTSSSLARTLGQDELENLGVVLTCAQGSIEVLDIVEASVVNGSKVSPEAQQLDFNAAVHFISKRWDSISEVRGKSFQNYVNLFLSSYKGGENLRIDIPDKEGDIVTPPGCVNRVVALQQIARSGGFTEFFLDIALWNKLSGFQQAVVLHGMYLQDESAKRFLIKSRFQDREAHHPLRLRQLNALWWSEALPVLTTQKWMGLLGDVGLAYFDYQGALIDISKEAQAGILFDQAGHIRAFVKVASTFHFGESKVFAGSTPLALSGLEVTSFYDQGQLECAGSNESSLLQVTIQGALEFFRSDREKRLCFFPSGRLKSGRWTFPWGRKKLPQMNSRQLRVTVGSADNLAGGVDNGSYVTFWENGNLKQIDNAFGEVMIQGAWRRIHYSLELNEDGQTLHCGRFKGTSFLGPEGTALNISNTSAQWVCFDKNQRAVLK